MFCRHCGAACRDGARFCAQCGAALEDDVRNATAGDSSARGQDSPLSMDADTFGQKSPRSYHPYQQLGGWLAFVAYASLVGAGLMVVLAIVELVSFIRLMSVYASYLMSVGPTLWLLEILILAVYVVTCILMIKFSAMIRSKDCHFLRFYELIMLIYAGLAVVTLILTGFHNVGDFFSSLLGAAIGFFIWTTYFRKSVRVRTYFGNDLYLRESIFFKNAQAPAPAGE